LVVWVIVLFIDVDVVVLGGGVMVLGDCMLRFVFVELDFSVVVFLFLWLLWFSECVDLLLLGLFVVVLGVVIFGVELE
ncbi:hypothetical protein ACPWSM_25565, partial [Pandoraea pneumonica]|uniref:hypothetical protein n=1 Tax=Pandoraea pneumonica TaxID=2508299 RepID=UPI003CF3A5A8